MIKSYNDRAQFEIYQSIWREASKLRSSGKLLKLGEKIKVPAYIIHGEYDPTFYKGIYKPLSQVIKNTNFYTLKNCGHMLWNERHGRQEFFKLLYGIINKGNN